MKRKCHCGEMVKSFNNYENTKEEFKTYHYFCPKCRTNFTTLVYADESIKLIRGFIGKIYQS